jgi:hypothetical protein
MHCTQSDQQVHIQQCRTARTTAISARFLAKSCSPICSTETIHFFYAAFLLCKKLLSNHRLGSAAMGLAQPANPLHRPRRQWLCALKSNTLRQHRKNSLLRIDKKTEHIGDFNQKHYLLFLYTTS